MSSIIRDLDKIMRKFHMEYQKGIVLRRNLDRPYETRKQYDSYSFVIEYHDGHFHS
jgi:hypothetical protein